MGRRRNEEATIPAICLDEKCGAFEVEVHIEGRYNAEGDFEAFEEQDLLCSECDTLLNLEAAQW